MPATMRLLQPAQIEEEAEKLLRRLELFSVPVNPVTVAERLKIGVYSAGFHDQAIDGILRQEDSQYRIYVNSLHNITRQRYAIAHEIGHFALHREIVDAFVDPEINMFLATQVATASERDDSGVRETQANIFAAALLMPAELVIREFRSLPIINKLAQRFEVSRQAMGHRLANLPLRA